MLCLQASGIAELVGLPLEDAAPLLAKQVRNVLFIFLLMHPCKSCSSHRVTHTLVHWADVKCCFHMRIVCCKNMINLLVCCTV